MVGEAGDFKCLRDPPQALCFTEAGAFLLAHTAGYCRYLFKALSRGLAPQGRSDAIFCAPVLVRFIAQIASRFGVVVTQKHRALVIRADAKALTRIVGSPDFLFTRLRLWPRMA
jgi:hypothetical protein